MPSRGSWVARGGRGTASTLRPPGTSTIAIPLAHPVDALPRLPVDFDALPGRGTTLVGVVIAVIAAGFLVVLSSVPVASSALPWVLLLMAIALGLIYVRAVHPIWRATLLLAGIGTCGAQFEHLLPSGPGFVIVFLTMLTLGYHLRLPWALLGAAPAVAVGAEAAGDHSIHPTEAMTSLVVGSVLLVIVASRAAAHLRSREQAERQRAEQDRAAAEAERTRLARELHDILTHSLSGLQLRLEGTRMLLADAPHTPTGPSAVDVQVAKQVDLAHQLAIDGLTAARRAITSLRGDPLASPRMLPALLQEVQESGLLARASLEVRGTPRSLSPEAGQAVFRTVQEALTNVARHAGPRAQARVTLAYLTHGVTVEIVNTCSTPAPEPSIPSVRPERAGYGLQGLAERAALLGGCLQTELLPDGYRVRLSLPTTLPGTD